METRRSSELFAAEFGRAPQVVARAPGRVNLIGEHTDYNEGFVLPMALRENTWCACAARPGDRCRVRSLEFSASHEWRIGSWSRDALPHWTSYVAGVTEILQRRGLDIPGFDLLVCSDVPTGKGLSSSAALEVSVAHALVALAGGRLSDKVEYADVGREAEHEFAGVPCGIMDQYISVFGRADTALLLDCRSRRFEYIPLDLPGHRLIVVDSGVHHELAGGEYARRRRECSMAVAALQRRKPGINALRDVSIDELESAGRDLDPPVAARARHVISENARTLAAADALRSHDAAALGELFTASHASLRDDYAVSCAELDRLVTILLDTPGVRGARLTGGGFGGGVVAVVADKAVRVVRESIACGYDGAGIGRSQLLLVSPGDGAAVEYVQ